MSVVIETTKGIFTVDLYIEQRPKICKNFLKLCKVKYYNFCLFNSIQSGFLAQTGDPNGNGRGGESIFRRLYGDQAKFFEGDLLPKIKHLKKGLLSMVNCGQNLFGSQFFITLGEDLDYLNDEHSVFGEITEGHEIIDVLNDVITDSGNVPYQDVRITHTVVLEDPFDDPADLEIPPKSPEPTPELLATNRIGADENFDEYEGKSAEEIAEIVAEKEAKAKATILEMIGDLPDADCAPPENVLFVCKLNPVTNDEDLEIIFSRFGKIVCCEVIRDRKTGDSLQYAFVEFENSEACERAYFKMDNVLIDDRRIHVDFSQSVSKYKWKGKGRLEIINDEKSNRKENKSEKPRSQKRRQSPDKKYRNRSEERQHRRQSPVKRHRHRSPERHHRRNRSPIVYKSKKSHRRSSSREESRRKYSSHERSKHRKYSPERKSYNKNRH